MLYLDLFCESVSKMRPKVIESSLDTVSATKGFIGTVISGGRGNLYIPDERA